LQTTLASFKRVVIEIICSEQDYKFIMQLEKSSSISLSRMF
jgi:hypothetical protein